MEKKQEIEILQSLKGDTYFAQFFGGLDIDIMCENIKNDYPIELNCAFNKKAEIAEKEKRDMRSHFNEKIENMTRSIIDACDGYLEEGVNDILVHEVGKLFIIKHKRSKGYSLTDKEIDYLIEFMDKKIGD